MTPSKRLCITLLYLASGDAHISIASSLRVSPATVGRIIHVTCDALWNEILVRGFLTVAHTHAEWNQIAADF